MRKLHIYRKKYFNGCMVPYQIIINYDYDRYKRIFQEISEEEIQNMSDEEIEKTIEASNAEFKEKNSILKNIKNGKKIEIEVPNEESNFFVACNNDLYLLTISENIKIPSGNEDIYVVLKTKMHLKNNESILEIVDRKDY